VWMIMAIWGGIMNLTLVVVNWRGRAAYERARADSLVAMAQAVRTGGVVLDERPDGTRLQVEVPPSRLTAIPGQWPYLAPSGDGVAHPR
jgi:hypothetical protein